LKIAIIVEKNTEVVQKNIGEFSKFLEAKNDREEKIFMCDNGMKFASNAKGRYLAGSGI
jgi:hypothetical protein